MLFVRQLHGMLDASSSEYLKNTFWQISCTTKINRENKNPCMSRMWRKKENRKLNRKWVIQDDIRTIILHTVFVYLNLKINQNNHNFLLI